MRLLAIETATSVASVAVVDDSGVLAEAVLRSPMRHLEWLLPVAGQLLEQLDLEPAAIQGLAVSRGPGGFTGLRIGIATAAGWAKAGRVPLVGVDTLEALACVPGVPGLILPVLDAHRGEVAGALYRLERAGRPVCLLPPLVASPEAFAAEVAAHTGPLLLVGDALARYGARLRAALGDRARAAAADVHPRAAAVGVLALPRLSRGERVDPDTLAPVYGRRPVVWPRQETPGRGGNPP
ncbi:MAG TPA: tRNA (adenosine(37)-N6)-threonylcarbamoyltransferase complex dimerization subunit type 1 TsaB [bacterium]|nr:tRNA (adenosine(37)-N6)-threonylcarbamoyltransferase complex dimerization subunit type 1 TsaB [bacterium]